MKHAAIAAAVAAVFVAGNAGAADLKTKHITIGTNPQGTFYNVLGNAMAKVFTDELGVRSTAQPYAGSSVYIPLVHSGEVTFGFSSNLDAGLTYRGDDRSAAPKVRSVARMWQLPYAYMTRASDNIKSIADLKGKRVVIHYQANKSLNDANDCMLKAGGIAGGQKDITPVTVGGIPQAIAALKEGTADAVPVAVAIPLNAQANTEIPGGVYFPPMTGPNANQAFMEECIPGFGVMDIEPSERNVGIKAKTLIGSLAVFFITGADMPDGDIKTVMTKVEEKWPEFQKQYGVLRPFGTDAWANTLATVPYHPAAIAYYKEKGRWNDKLEALNAKLLTQAGKN